LQLLQLRALQRRRVLPITQSSSRTEPPTLCLSLRPSTEEHNFLESLNARVVPKWDRRVLALLEEDAHTPGRRAAIRALRSLHYVIADDDRHARSLLDRLSSAEQVLDARLTTGTGPTSFVAALEPASIATPEFDSNHQAHLDPAPAGINARYAWQHDGSGGTGVHMYIMEGGWSRRHPELAGLPIYDLDRAKPEDAARGIIPLANAVECPATGSSDLLDHGAKVLSLLFAPDQKPASSFDESSFPATSITTGVTGIVPYVSRIAIGTQHDQPQSTLNGKNMARAIAAAIHSARKNPTVLLVERQIENASAEGLGPCWKNVIKTPPRAVPFDSTFDSYIDIVAAVQFGVHVIIPMGNGSDQTLDGNEYALDKVYAALRALYVQSFRASPDRFQPIRVAAARRIDGAWKYNDPSFNTATNYAHAADCFGPVPVVTADRTGITGFTQTSAASAVIAGAAASILGRAYAKGIKIAPNTLRSIFRQSVNGQNVVDALPEQVLPDLAKIFRRELGDRAPDLYLGKASDLIVHPTPLGAEPLTARRLSALYGHESGTENQLIGPRQVKAGEKYAICVRVRNRGRITARNVLVRIFSAPLSPMSTRGKWEYVGSSWMFNVRTGSLPVISPPVIWTAPRSGHASFVAEVTCGGENPQPDRKSVSTWPELVQLALKNDNLAFRSVSFAPFALVDRFLVGEGMINVFGLLPSQAKLAFDVESNVPVGSSISVLTPQSFLRPGEQEKWIRLELQGGRARIVERAFTEVEQHQLHFRVEVPADAHRVRYSVALLQKHEGVEVGRAFIYLDPIA
jgi:serine protease